MRVDQTSATHAAAEVPTLALQEQPARPIGDSVQVDTPVSSLWTVIAPDGRMFFSDSAHKAANEANRATRTPEQQAAADACLAAMQVKHDSDMRAEHEHLNCPACGGSGHVDDVTATADEPWNMLERALSWLSVAHGVFCGADQVPANFDELSGLVIEVGEAFIRRLESQEAK